jgi:hypothetical protein
MLTREKVMAYVSAIVTTLYDLETDTAESTLYLALGMNLQLWNDLKGLLVASDLVTVKSHRVALTVKGMDLARDCNKIVADAKVAEQEPREMASHHEVG